VTLGRTPDSSPAYLRDLLNPDDAVQCSKFDSRDSQAERVAQQIKVNLRKGELDERDILIIFANALTAKKEAARLIGALDKHHLSAHLVGLSASVDQLFQDGSIAIFRAKGTKPPWFTFSTQTIARTHTHPIKGRNTLFTAITRSRAWVRLYGVGDGMPVLISEIEAVRR
jgi:superfamily I DNA and RNA helicase